jgi:hypothetical protein
MVARHWRPIPSVLMRHFNGVHGEGAISLYTARSWLRGEYLPRPQRLLALAKCLGVPPHHLMYGHFYQAGTVAEREPGMVLSEREHRIIQCLRRLSSQGQAQLEQTAWRLLSVHPRQAERH